jgi:FKBP12-rapamycin complex-associated protein
VELLRESPSSALRACASLAQIYQPLAWELFNAAFVSCWKELAAEGLQESLVSSIETALDADSLSPEIIQTLLNLAEFMEHDDKPLPIDIRKLGALAEKCHTYAKALHYREMEFHSYPATTIEALISINNQLQQPEAAKGILVHARLRHQVNA